MKFLFDTNVVSEVRRPSPDPKVLNWIGSLREDQIYLSVATIAELKRGINLMPNGRRRLALAAWADSELPLRIGARLLPILATTCEIWAEVTGASDRKGHKMDTLDAFIASTAIEHGLVLVTRNVKDFKFTQVELFNPWED